MPNPSSQGFQNTTFFESPKNPAYFERRKNPKFYERRKSSKEGPSAQPVAQHIHSRQGHSAQSAEEQAAEGHRAHCKEEPGPQPW